MPYARPDTNAFIQGHPRRADSRNPASYQLPFPACYGAMSASSGFWDQMDVHQRSRILNHLMADQMDQHQPFSRPSCQYIDRQSHNAPQFPTSHGIPSLGVPNGFGFWTSNFVSTWIRAPFVRDNVWRKYSRVMVLVNLVYSSFHWQTCKKIFALRYSLSMCLSCVLRQWCYFVNKSLISVLNKCCIKQANACSLFFFFYFFWDERDLVNCLITW